MKRETNLKIVHILLLSVVFIGQSLNFELGIHASSFIYLYQKNTKESYDEIEDKSDRYVIINKKEDIIKVVENILLTNKLDCFLNDSIKKFSHQLRLIVYFQNQSFTYHNISEHTKLTRRSPPLVFS
ncbi:MAG: hypothetical protein N2249_07765 [Melioribacter sp.]|nr:hypothetical protein [Melioribacter sp.]